MHVTETTATPPAMARGADLLMAAISGAGVKRIFALSGNQIMSLFDASIGTDVELLHVRQEAATVHMADAWGRLTGEPGVALVTAGPGFANALSALYVAKMSESPMVLLSGHAATDTLGKGAFQEMAQAEMASHVTKASWTANDATRLGRDLTRAFEVARSGRPGPVHLAVPFDLLESAADDVDGPEPVPEDPIDDAGLIDEAVALRILDEIASAQRPLVLTGPAMMRGAGPELAKSLAEEAHVPVIGMESPRGINDPSLGAFAEVLAEADLVVALGKKLDFTLKFGEAPTLRPDCRIIQVDAESSVLEQTRAVVDGSNRLALSTQADPMLAAKQLVEVAKRNEHPSSGWYDEVQAAISYRPSDWKTFGSGPDGPLHAAAVGGAINEFLASVEDSVFISDGGEFGQWAQATISAPHRIINGTAASIGTPLPFAIAARLAFPDSRIVATLGDGTFGFHGFEFDTAVRYELPFIAVVGNDAAWNSEYQIQLNDYGPERLIGCELLPTRYDNVVEVLGGHGENVTTVGDLAPALSRALDSDLPACVNGALERNVAPIIRR